MALRPRRALPVTTAVEMRCIQCIMKGPRWDSRRRAAQPVYWVRSRRADGGARLEPAHVLHGGGGEAAGELHQE